MLLLFCFINYVFVEGFGLFITKGIVDLHHGDIRVFSKGEGTGCTFIVDLPMTRKMEPIVVVNHTQRRSTRDRIVGLLNGQSSRRHPTSPPVLIPAPQDVNNQAASNSLQPINKRLPSPMVIDDPVPLSKGSSGARIDPNPPDEVEVRPSGSVMSKGRQSLRDLAEHDRTVTSAARQAKATTLPHKPSIDCCSFPTSNPEREDASCGGLAMSSPSPRGEHTCDDAVVAIGSDHAADPPSQQLRPAATTMVTSSASPVPAPAQESAPLSLTAPAPPLSAAPSRKSKRQPQGDNLLPQGPVYHVLVVDDSTMTRKMLMKTLRNGGLTHPLNILNISSHLPNSLKTPPQLTLSHPLLPCEPQDTRVRRRKMDR